MGIVTGDGDLKIATPLNIYHYSIDYQEAYEHNFKNDVQKALKYYLNEKDKSKYWEVYEQRKNGIDIEQKTNLNCFILYPQALNPFLKIMESLKEIKHFIVLPAFDNEATSETNSPAYLLGWMDETQYPSQITTKNI